MTSPQIVDFPTRIPDRDDHQPYLLDIFLVSHPPLGKSEHMVVSVDVKFVVKSTNEHPYHCTVYSYSKADWDGLRDHLRYVPWIDIFKHDATYAPKEIAEWVEIGIDCYIPHRKFQFKPHSSPWFTPCAAVITHRNHYFHQYHRNATLENKKLFCDSHNRCKRVLKYATSNYAETTRRSFASQLIGYRDFWKICNSVLNRGKSTMPPLMMVHNSFPIFHLVLNRDLALRISRPKWFLVQSKILMHPKQLVRQNSSHCP